MKKTTQRKGNVFADIGIPNAGEHALKADVVIKLARMIELKTSLRAKRQSSPASPNPTCPLLRGKFDGFSMDRLLQALMALGSDIEIRVKKPVQNRRGHGRVLAAFAK